MYQGSSLYSVNSNALRKAKIAYSLVFPSAHRVKVVSLVNSSYNLTSSHLPLNPIALRSAKTQQSFGHSGCNRFTEIILKEKFAFQAIHLLLLSICFSHPQNPSKGEFSFTRQNLLSVRWKGSLKLHELLPL